jgi:hypothetical protein
MRRFAGRAAGMCGTVMLAAAALVLGAPVAPAGAASGVSGAWQIQASPDETVPGGSIEAVSCSSAAACTAVGSYLDSAGRGVPLAEAWNGTSWRKQPVPGPAGAPAPQLRGVSCPSAGFCAAVGSTNNLGSAPNAGLAESWNGSSWRIQPVPVPAGATRAEFTGVSCVSAGFCEAVGDYMNGAGTFVSLAEIWNGTSWSVQPVPLPAGSQIDRLDAVSCTSADFCAAVDFYSPTAEMWDGTTWTARPVPFPAGASSPGFEGVSCASASFCEAVGIYDDPQVAPAGRLLADAWNGTSWHLQPDPKLDGISTNLGAVSCVSPLACEAVGYREVFVSGADTFRSIAEVWHGTSWEIQRTTSGTGTAGTSLAGVSCVSATACEAGGAFPAWMEAWNGTSWRTQRPVRPGGATNNSLSGISVPVGAVLRGGGHGHRPGPAEGWDGTSWRIQPGTLPAALSGVSCTSADFCEAVGGITLAGAPAAAVWDGTSWRAQPTPAVDYTGVSCPAANYCQAVGPSGAMTWNGTAWSAETLPYPSPLGIGDYYRGISCSSASACVAVGGRTSTGGAFTASWNGTSWTLETVPPPAGATSATLTQVSCVSAGSCEAVGNASPTGGFAEAWNGTTWTAQQVPSPAGASTSLFGVSCTSASACTAVGSAFDHAPYAQLTLAEAWNGTSWSVQPTPSPNATHNELIGVSCGAPGACTAVGTAGDPGGFQATLAESGG